MPFDLRNLSRNARNFLRILFTSFAFSVCIVCCLRMNYPKLLFIHTDRYGESGANQYNLE